MLQQASRVTVKSQGNSIEEFKTEAPPLSV